MIGVHRENAAKGDRTTVGKATATRIPNGAHRASGQHGYPSMKKPEGGILVAGAGVIALATLGLPAVLIQIYRRARGEAREVAQSSAIAATLGTPGTKTTAQATAQAATAQAGTAAMGDGTRRRVDATETHLLL